MLLPISHPSSVYLPTTTKHGEKTHPPSRGQADNWPICSHILWCIPVTVSTCLTTWFWITEEIVKSFNLVLTHSLDCFLYIFNQICMNPTYLLPRTTCPLSSEWFSTACYLLIMKDGERNHSMWSLMDRTPPQSEGQELSSNRRCMGLLPFVDLRNGKGKIINSHSRAE